MLSEYNIFRKKWRRIETEAQVRVLDICAGAGGFSLGFQAAGYELVGTIEIDADAASSYASNLHFPYAPSRVI